jgi:hypothetical protein
MEIESPLFVRRFQPPVESANLPYCTLLTGQSLPFGGFRGSKNGLSGARASRRNVLINKSLLPSTAIR